MNFWHMQLHPNNLGWQKEEELLKSTGLIGLGDWKEGGTNQQKNFEETMAIGDVVAIKRGEDIVALVKVIGGYEYTKEIGDLDWFERRRRIQILDWYKPSYNYYIAGRGTLTRCSPTSEAKSNISIRNWLNKIINPTSMNNHVSVLEYKKQIILQGPPGTGKTRLAKEIAKTMCFPKRIDVDFIKNAINTGQIIRSAKDFVDYKVIAITNAGITLQNESSKNSVVGYAEIIRDFESQSWQNGTIQNGAKSYTAAIAKFVYQSIKIEELTNFKLAQFHPAYSYEDFVRGITAKVNGSQVEYQTENKVLGKFAKEALDNFNDSKKTRQTLSKEKWVSNELKFFAEYIQDEIDKNGKFPINETVSITEVEPEAFRYIGNTWAMENKNRLKYSDTIQEYLNEVKNRQDIKALSVVSGRARQHSSYDFKFLEKFREFLKTRPVYIEQNDVQAELKNFVLIIDEINRANLPAVLGELIYALEYRGERVDSMYAIDGESELKLPPNLYIIGTMNTADRSVGHIDYAIRRRFAFVDVLPNIEPIRDAGKELFKNVSELFIKNFDTINWNDPKPVRSEYLATDFRPEDIWLGHSYFITQEKDDNGNLLDETQQIEIKKKYEIIPILKEYVKDGILNEAALDIIKAL